MKTIHPFVQKKVVVLHHDDSAHQAARAMREHGIGCVVVSDHEGHVVGVITDRDLAAEVVAECRSALDARLGAIMSRDPVTVDENASIKEVLDLMERHGVRRIPVLEPSSGGAVRCVGIVTLDDLIMAKMVEIQQLRRIISAQLSMSRLPLHERRRDPVKERDELNRFYAEVERRIGADLEFSQGELEMLCSLVLTGFARRLTRTARAHLAGQLPYAHRAALLAMPEGTQHDVTLVRLVSEAAQLFELDKEGAFEVIAGFCAALESWADPRELAHIKAQLPQELRDLFPRAPERPEEREAA